MSERNRTGPPGFLPLIVAFLLAVVGLAGAACGQSTDGAPSSTQASSAGAGGSQSSTQDGAGQVSTLNTIAAADSDTSFCKDSHQAEVSSSIGSGGHPSSAQILAAAQVTFNSYPTLISEAPTPTIKQDLQTIQAAVDPMLQDIINADGVTTNVPASDESSFSSGTNSPSNRDLSAFLIANCGFPAPTPSGNAAPGAPSSGSSSSGAPSSGGSSSGGS